MFPLMNTALSLPNLKKSKIISLPCLNDFLTINSFLTRDFNVSGSAGKACATPLPLPRTLIVNTQAHALLPELSAVGNTLINKGGDIIHGKEKLDLGLL